MSERPSAPHVPRASRPSVGVRARTAAEVPPPEARAVARTVTLPEAEASSVARIMATLPDPGDLAPGTLVVIPAEVAATRSLARSVLAVFGRVKTVPRTLRCSALLARGYVEIGAGDEERDDLAWGYVPDRT